MIESIDLLSQLPQWAGILITIIGLGALGAISTSTTLQGSDFFRTNVIAVSNSDTAVTIPHGLGAISNRAAADFRGLGPVDVTLTPLTVQFYASQWVVTTVNTTNVVLTKLSVTQSGSASPQVQLTVRRPHSVGR